MADPTAEHYHGATHAPEDSDAPTMHHMKLMPADSCGSSALSILDHSLFVSRAASLASACGSSTTSSMFGCGDACTCPPGGGALIAGGCGKIQRFGTSAGGSTTASSPGPGSCRSSSSGDDDDNTELPSGAPDAALVMTSSAGALSMVGGPSSLLSNKSAEFIMFSWKVVDCAFGELDHDW